MSMTKAQRDDLLQAHQAAKQALSEAEEAMTDEDDDLDAPDPRDPFIQETDRLEQAYWDGLPRVSLSACPYCDEHLIRAFDPWGIDGYFWQKRMKVEDVDPPSCPHFAVLVGAVNLNGRPPHGGPYEAHLGPEVPFVIPRVLSLPGMVAVVSTAALLDGCTAYPIAYFADPLPDPFYLTHPWGLTTMGFRRNGRAYWTIKNDPWEFDLEPWIAQGKLRWIVPGDADLRVLSAPAPCPYVALSGRRKPIVVKGDTLREETLPDGSDLGDPFE
jgi:hypothetical protein